MLLLFTLFPALASPDRVAWIGPSSTGSSLLSETQDLVVAPDGFTVLLADPSGGSLAALDTRSWDLDQVDLCEGTRGVGPWNDGSETRVYVGCADGLVRWATLEDGLLSSAESSIDIGAGEVLGLLVVEGLLYVLTEDPDGGYPSLHVVDPLTAEVDGVSGYPSTMARDGFVDMESNGTYLLVLHGSDNLSKVDISTGSVSSETNSLGSLDGQDLVAREDGGAFFAAGGPAVAWYDLSGNDWSLSLDSSDGLDEVDSICLLEESEELLVADGGASAFSIYEFFSASSTFGDEVLTRFDYGSAGETVSEMVRLADKVVIGTRGGELWVATGGPWVEVSAVTPSEAGQGDELSLAFRSDRDGTWELRLGADDDEGGSVLALGSLEAGEEIVQSVVIDEDWVEGANRLRVVVTGDNGLNGHDSAVVEVDNPPPKLSLSDESVGIGDEYLTLSFQAPSDEDLSSVRVYLSVTAFEAESWATGGGPDFDGDDPIEEADLLYAVAPDESLVLVISPLTNDQTYYLAARAIDAGGLEGEMSSVVSGTPRQTFSVADRSGESGGFCGLTGAPAAGLALFGLLAASRRRRSLGALGLAALVALPGAASAKESDPEENVKGATALRVGPMTFADDNAIVEVLGERGHNVFWLETGPSWKGYVQFTFGAGYYRKKGTLLASTGESSTQDDLLWAVPVTGNLTLRLDVLREQVLVPYVTGGGDLWFWREQWTTNADGDKTGIGGGKWGYHYGVGGQLLLDVFDRGRAGLAFSRMGMKDSYVVGEWRRQEIGVFQEGLDLSGSQFTLGLGIHY
jgi:hypothetical protein